MKKRVCLILLVLALMLFATPVFARNITSCDAALGTDVIIDAKIPKTVSTIITAIKVLVPVLLVIFGMIDLVKGITAQKEDDIKKGQKTLVKRIIAGAIVFFVFSGVQLLISFVGDDDKKNIMTCAKCFINNECTYDSIWDKVHFGD